MPDLVFDSTQTGAPVLTGQNAKLNDLMKACLVDGFNSGSCTITRSGSVATVSRAGHGFPAAPFTPTYVQVSGADQSDYNVVAPITYVDANTFTYPVANSPATPATGAMTVKRAPAGWSTPFYDAASETRVFKTADGLCHLQMQDNGPGAAAAREVRIRGYAGMSAYNSGTDPFPTVAQMSNGAFLRKSSTADATARAWALYANENTLHLLIETGDTANQAMLFTWGKFTSDKAGDVWNYLLAARSIENNFSFVAETAPARQGSIQNVTLAGLYLVRNVQGVSGAVPAGQHSDTVKAKGSGVAGGDGVTYPNPATGGADVDLTWVHESSQVRGVVPGLWTPLHNRPLAHRGVISIVDGLVTRHFRAFNVATGGNGQVWLEESSTWMTV